MKKYAYETADRLIERFNTREPDELCFALGINIIYTELGTLNGMFARIKRNNFIFLSKSLGSREAKITAAHELGHAVLRHNISQLHACTSLETSLRRREEREAEIFAAELLLSDRATLSAMKRYDAHGAAAALGVPISLFLAKVEIIAEKNLKNNSDFCDKK